MSNSVVEKPLTDRERRVFDLLNAEPNTDVEIYKLYEAMSQSQVHLFQNGVLLLGITPRTMQMRLGSVIARINEKLDKGKVVPGQMKQTYRLDTTAK